MKKQSFTLLGLLLVGCIALFQSGCATIINGGGGRDVSIDSKPSGAKITITSDLTNKTVYTGTTPATVKLRAKGGYFTGHYYTVKLELDGYRSEEVKITPHLSGWYFGNLLIGGLIGMVIVDPLTGAMFYLAPENIQQDLSAEQAGIIKEEGGFIVCLVSSLTDAEKSKMIRVN